MPGPALTPEAAIERLGATSGDVRTAILLDERDEVAAHVGDAKASPQSLREVARHLFQAADAAGARAGTGPVGRVEVSRPDGGVFGLRERDGRGAAWTLVAVTAAGALSSLVLYDMRMAVLQIGRGA